MKIKLEEFPHYQELKILGKTLLKSGDELRLVGGCVRDYITKKPISDIDLACQYFPEKTIEILNKNNIKALPTGIKHGTITAIINNKNFEITTLRIDKNTDGRHAEVEFTNDFFLDAERRDFTINAMSIDFNGELFDYFNGKNDLENCEVKFIGNAETRIKEDYLRILRFFRFSCNYANTIDDHGLKACIKLKDQISNLSSERIKNELTKILSCNKTKSLELVTNKMLETSILNTILRQDVSNLDHFHNLLFFENKLKEGSNYLLRFAAIISGCNNWLEIAKNLRFSNQENNYLRAILKPNFIINLQINNTDLEELLFDYKKEIIIDNLILNLIQTAINDQKIIEFLSLKYSILGKKLPDFPLNGNDLLKLKISPERIGYFLKIGRKYWIENNYLPNSTQIMNFIKISY